MDFKVGDRVRVRAQVGSPSFVKAIDGEILPITRIVTDPDDVVPYLVDAKWWMRRCEVEPVSASLSACERVLWASTQEYLRKAAEEAETKREGYLSAFRQVVEEDRPELVGRDWSVEDGRFVVQQ